MGNNYIWGDIPSRIVREQGFLEEGQQNRRYTITYSEETRGRVMVHVHNPIYPHV